MNKSILVLVAIVIVGVALAPLTADAQGVPRATTTKTSATNVRPRTTSKYSNKLTSRKAVAPRQAKVRQNNARKEARNERGQTAASVIRRNREAARDTRRDGRRLPRNVIKQSNSRHVTFRTNDGRRS